MIINLRVKNVALIDEAEVQFGEGLNILTGETGAGKSILIDSINFLLGERPGKDIIRSGADMALVEGIFLVKDSDTHKAISDLGIEFEEELLLSRSLNAQHRSTCRVNGRTVNVGMLKEISSHLVDIHGQHQHQFLLDANKHIVLLDRFCGEELDQLKEELSELIVAHREISKELKALQGAPGQREAQIEIWQFQIDEISEAQLKPGEEEALEQQRTRLSAVEKISKYSQSALYMLYGGNFDVSSATDQVGKALQQLTDLARLDESKQSLADRLTDLSIQLADIVGELSDYSKSLDADPYTLERVETRLDMIYRLKKKYGGSVDDILAHLEKISAKLDKYAGSEGEILRLNTKRRESMQAIAAKCNEMTALRRRQAEMIQDRIVENLRELGMKNVQFAIAMEKQAAFSTNGNDRLEFMISPNLGESLKPLSQIASGGEMSRVMLALKTVMADVDKIGTLVFDEIDAGVSGRTAQQVAEKLAQISSINTSGVRHQILCITHLPQIAAMADKHFLISKGIVKGELGGHTLTFVKELNHYGIIEELARLIGGAQITESTLRAAEEMKAFARPTPKLELIDTRAKDA